MNCGRSSWLISESEEGVEDGPAKYAEDDEMVLFGGPMD